MSDLQDAREKHLRHEVYEGSSAYMKKVLLKDFSLGIDEKQADWLANQLCNYLSEYWAGQTITFAKDHYFKIDERDFEIFDKVNRRNFKAVAREYNLTPNGLYRVIKRIRARAVARAGQQDMFTLAMRGNDDKDWQKLEMEYGEGSDS